MPGIYLKPLYKYLSTLAFIILLSGCVYGLKTDFLSHYNKIIDQPLENINIIKSEFENNPSKSQQLGEELLKLLYSKHHALGTEVSRLPDIRDGISPEEAKALDKFYKIVKTVHIPVDLANYKKALHRIKIEWTGGPGDWSAKIPYGINFPKHKIHNVKTIGFEKNDEIDIKLLNEKGFLMWYSKLDKGDSDAVIVEMDYPIHRPFVIEQIRQNGIGYSTIADLMMKRKMEFVNLNGLNITYMGERKNPNDIFELTKEIIINEALIMGKGKKFSPALEALFWAVIDKKYSDEELNKYSNAIEMTKGFWAKMEGQRWQDYNAVVDRLSDKFLLFHYSATKIKYKYYRGNEQYAINVFRRKFGDCYDQSIFNRAVLLRAGVKTHLIRVHRAISFSGKHIILAFDQKDGTWVLDSGTNSKLVGPFKSWKDIPYDIIEKIY